MQPIWNQIFTNLIRGMDLGRTMRQAMGLTLAAAVFTLPYFHYLIFHVPRGQHRPIFMHPWRLLGNQLFLLVILCLIASLTGLVFSRRLKLPGLGDFRQALESLPFILAAGGLLLFLSYGLFDRHFFDLSPTSYPQDWIYVVTFPLKGAFTDEIILRLCLVTLAVGLCRRKLPAVVITSALVSFFSIKYWQFMGITPMFERLFVTQLVLSFTANVLLGHIYLNRGLLAAMLLRLVFGLKYALVALTMG